MSRREAFHVRAFDLHTIILARAQSPSVRRSDILEKDQQNKQLFTSNVPIRMPYYITLHLIQMHGMLSQKTTQVLVA